MRPDFSATTLGCARNVPSDRGEMMENSATLVAGISKLPSGA